MNEITLLGGGKHCKVVLDVLEQVGGYSVKGISDLPEKKGTPVLDGYTVNLADQELEESPDGKRFAFVTHGEHLGLRKKLYCLAKEKGYVLPVLISPQAYISRHSRLGAGTLAAHRATVNPGAHIGVNAILNTGSIVEHDCVIGDHSHLAPGAVLCGSVQVGESTFIGAAAVVIPDIQIGDNVLVGAGAVVRENVPDNVVVVGNPARFLRTN